MRKYWPVVVAATFTMSSVVTAQEASQAGAARAPAAEAAVGTAVAERALSGAAESFPAGTAKLVCFSKVTNLAADSEIEHVWYKGDAEQARVKLRVGGSPWRTHSSKTMPADAAGEWRCDVVHDGKVLQSAKFKVE
jgi:hypothetical protein